MNQTVEDETNFKFINFARNAIYMISNVIPNIIINEVDYSSVRIPRHWKLSDRHMLDIQKIIENNYKSLSQFYGKREITEILQKIGPIIQDFMLLIDEFPILTTDGFTSKDDESVTSESSQKSSQSRTKEKLLYRVFNRTVTEPLFKQFFLIVLNLFLIVKDEKEIRVIQKESSIPTNTFGSVNETVTSEEIQSLATGEISEIDVIEAKEYTINSVVSEFLTEILVVLHEHKRIIDYNAETIMDRVLYSKEKEKEEITEYLKEMTDEERAVENIIKNSKLERWSKGLQKGLTQYVKETYDEEREAIEKRANAEAKLGLSNMVTDMNRDIYVLEMEEQDDIDAEIERDEMDLSGLAEDDDYGDRDGDEHF